MSDIKITTNNVPRDVIDAWQLTPAERAEFDYLDWPAIDDGRNSASFFRYRGQLYDLGEFMRVESGGDLAGAGWQGYSADSFFSGTLIRHPVENWGMPRDVIDPYRVIVGRYYC